MDLPDDPCHMQFLKTLDIDGISEHTQLFRLESDQVNQILRDTIKQHIQSMNMKELLRPDPFDVEPPEFVGFVDNSSISQHIPAFGKDESRHRIDVRTNLNPGGGLYFGNQAVRSGMAEAVGIS